MEFITWLVIGICAIAALCGIMSMFIVKDKHLDIEIEDTNNEENDS